MATRCLTLVLSAFVLLAPSASAAKNVRIDATASPWTVVGNHVRITGDVTPHLPGLALTLQQRKGSGWLAAGQRTVAADGRFSFVVQPPKAGLATYRIVPSDGSSYVGESARVPVRVLHWSYVGSIEAFTYLTPLVGDLSTAPIETNGVRYEHPVTLDAGCYNAWGGSAWIDYPLQRQYEFFTATLDLGGAASNGSTATYSVLGGDGKKLASGNLEFGGAPQKIKVSVSGEYRLRLRINVPDLTDAGACSSAYTQVVFGDAQLLGP